jgi:hypothetical protein
MKVVAIVTDLMDRSKISAAIPETTFARDTSACTGADVVILDYMQSVDSVAELRRALPHARIIAFGRHTDEVGAATAAAAGADVVWPRSRFFIDPAAALEPLNGGSG